MKSPPPPPVNLTASAFPATRILSHRRSGCGAIMKSCVGNETLRGGVGAVVQLSHTAVKSSPPVILPPPPQLASGQPQPRWPPPPPPRYATSADIVHEARRTLDGTPTPRHTSSGSITDAVGEEDNLEKGIRRLSEPDSRDAAATALRDGSAGGGNGHRTWSAALHLPSVARQPEFHGPSPVGSNSAIYINRTVIVKVAS